MDAIPPDLIGASGPAAMIVALFWMLATGRLITRREADGIRKDRDDWKAAHATEQANGRVSSAQVTELLEHARVTEAFMGALSELADNREPK